MKLLLDTHALLWHALNDPQLSADARRAILRRAADENLPAYNVATVARPWAPRGSHRLATVATGRFSSAARLNGENEAFVSPATYWELAIKISIE